MRVIWILLVVSGLVAAGVFAWARATASVETPDYAVERVDGAVELRRYPPLVLASVRRQGDRSRAVGGAFRPLADYIFAKSRGGEKIAMTAPVVQEPGTIAMTAPVVQEAGEEGWTVSFIMPAGRTLADLPDPAGDVTLRELPGRRMAALRFSGRWTDANFATHAARLVDWVAAQGLTPKGPVEYAYYNDPFTPWFLRRNEVMVEVVE
jgi:hypothetical protein